MPRTRWRWVGVLAAVALAASSWGSGSRPELHRRILWPGLSWQVPTGGSPLLATVSVLAMVALVLAWWRARAAWHGVDAARWWRVTAALWFAPLVASVPLYSRDLYSYAAQGALWAQGLSPYEHGVADLDSPWRSSTAPTWLDTPSPYGPVWLLVARAAAELSGGRLWLALLLLRLVCVLALVALAWAVGDLALRLGTSEGYAAGLAVAAPLVGAHFVSGGHNDALMVAGVVVAFALALRRRFVGACVVVALAAMVKVTAVVALPFVVLLWARGVGRAGGPLRGWGPVVRAGAAAGAVVVAVSGVLTWATGLGWSWLNPAPTAGRNEQWTSLPTGLGMAVGSVGHVLGHPEWRDAAISGFRTVALPVLAVVLVLVWLTAARPMGRPDLRQPRDRATEDVARVVRACGWAYLAVVLLAPAFLGWYFLWALPLLAVARGHGRLDPALTRWLPVAVTVLCFAQLPDGYSLGLTTTAVGVPLVLVATFFLVRAAARWAGRTDWRHLLDLTR